MRGSTWVVANTLAYDGIELTRPIKSFIVKVPGFNVTKNSLFSKIS
jgi:hypothetical protein